MPRSGDKSKPKKEDSKDKKPADEKKEASKTTKVGLPNPIDFNQLQLNGFEKNI
jgi:hypothetical protein